jgi:hypothetical protein
MKKRMKNKIDFYFEMKNFKMSDRLWYLILQHSVKVAFYRRMTMSFYKEMSKIMFESESVKFREERIIVELFCEDINRIGKLDMKMNLFEKAIMEKLFPNLTNFYRFEKLIINGMSPNSIFWKICPLCFHIIDRDYGPDQCSSIGELNCKSDNDNCQKYTRCREWCVNFYNKPAIKQCRYENCENFLCDECEYCEFHQCVLNKQSNLGIVLEEII